MIDSDLLRLGIVYNELIRPTDFASDNLVKALVSYPTIEKLKGAHAKCESTVEGNKGSLAVNLFFIHLQLYSVNGKSISSSHRVVYLWCSMLWLTSICGVSIITKSNFVSAIIHYTIASITHVACKLCNPFYNYLVDQYCFVIS